MREKGHLEDPGENGNIILKCIFTNWDGGMGWIDLAQNRDGWRGSCEWTGLTWLRTGTGCGVPVNGLD